MAQRRMISRRITESEKLLSLAQAGEYRALWLYTAMLPFLDREGRMNANPLGLKSGMWEAWPITLEELCHDVDTLAESGLVRLYKSPRHALVLEYERFGDFNTPDKREPASDLPGPNDRGCRPTTATTAIGGEHLPPETTRADPRTFPRKHRPEWNGIEGKSLTDSSPDDTPPDEPETAGRAPEGAPPMNPITRTYIERTRERNSPTEGMALHIATTKDDGTPREHELPLEAARYIAAQRLRKGPPS